jgi:hypothetical protein
MCDIKKRGLKDIAHNMMQQAINDIYISIEHSKFTQSQKEYMTNIFEKQLDVLCKKVTDLNYFEMIKIDEMIEYANKHKGKGNG